MVIVPNTTTQFPFGWGGRGNTTPQQTNWWDRYRQGETPNRQGSFWQQPNIGRQTGWWEQFRQGETPNQPGYGRGSWQPRRPQGGYYENLRNPNWRGMSWQPYLNRGLTRVGPLPQYQEAETTIPEQPVVSEQPVTAPVATPQEYFLGWSSSGQPIYMQQAAGGGYQQVYKPYTPDYSKGGLATQAMQAPRLSYEQLSQLPPELRQMRQQMAPYMNLNEYNEWIRQNKYIGG
jgi:hypothetical protein